jgi:hypothetical protein
MLQPVAPVPSVTAPLYLVEFASNEGEVPQLETFGELPATTVADGWTYELLASKEPSAILTTVYGVKTTQGRRSAQACAIKGREYLGHLLELQPGLTVAAFIAYAARVVSPELTATYVDGFRKVGLPEE